MLNTSLAPWPSFTEEEVAAVSRVLQSNRVNYWTGEECRAFEHEFAQFTGSAHAVALSNGTLALDIALNALKVGPGDEVIVTPRTFIASVSSVINAGGRPVFADVDRDTGNISPATIERVLTPRTKGMVPVHLAGWPCDMTGIMALARDRNLFVVEDCAQAHGASHHGRSVGVFGDVAAWSFCQDKIMTTGGEGGMVTTDDADLWSAMWSFKDHGKSWKAVYETQHAPGFRWVHESIGTNWRMLEMQAVIGRIQLMHMAETTRIRRRNAMRIAETLAPFDDLVRVPLPDEAIDGHAFYRLYAYVKPDALGEGWSRDRIVAEITARKGVAFQGTCSEVYLEKAFDGTDLRPAERLQVARELGETSLMFLTHPTLTDQDLDRMASVLGEVLTLARR